MRHGLLLVLVVAALSRAESVAPAVKPSPAVSAAILKLRSPRPADRVQAARFLAGQKSDVVPALLPWNWGCGTGRAREGAEPKRDCARINEATYHVVAILSAIARREPALCERENCPARQALFQLTTAQGGIDWDLLPLEEDEAQLAESVRDEALLAYARARFLEAFPLPEWRGRSARPAARSGSTAVFVERASTAPRFDTACAIAVYVERAGQRVGKLVLADAPAAGLGCEVTRVRAEVDAQHPDVLALAVDWVAQGGDSATGQTLMLARISPRGSSALCSVYGVGTTDLLARRGELLRLAESGCVDAKGHAVGLDEPWAGEPH